MKTKTILCTFTSSEQSHIPPYPDGAMQAAQQQLCNFSKVKHY